MIDAIAWYESIKHKVWWRDIGFNECFHLMKITKRAHDAGSKYFMNDALGDPINLTEIYEQCRIHYLLKETHGNEK